LGDLYAIDSLGKEFSPPISEWLENLLELLVSAAGKIIVLRGFEVSLSDIDELFLLVLVEVLEGELIDRVIKEEDLKSLLQETFNDG